MRETKFIEQNKEKWANFEQQLRFEQRDPELLNRLFVEITDDLSYARSFYPNRSVRMYLNGLAQRVFHNVYKGKRSGMKVLGRFWSYELPKIMWETRKALLLSFAVFVLSFAIGVVSSIINPDFAQVVLGEEYVEMTLENIEAGDPMAVYKRDEQFGMSVGIAANNLFVAFQTAISGVAASVGTLLIMVHNGIMVGAFQYFFIEHGVFWESFFTIWIHGTLEISAIIIAGAAGLVAGSGLLFPGTYRRTQAFGLSMRRGIKIFLGIIPVIVLAAFFEGFLTRYTETPQFVRAIFIGVSLFFVLWYFVWLPRHLAKSGAFRNAGDDAILPPDVHQVFAFNRIKTSGEVISDTFTLVKRHPKTVLFGIFGSAIAFFFTGILVSGEHPWDTFMFGREFMDMFKGTKNFFENARLPFVFWIQTLFLTIITFVGMRAVESELPDNERIENPLARRIAVGLLLILPTALMSTLYLFGHGFWIYLFAMLILPFASQLSAALYFESANPFVALGRAFSISRWGHLLTTGFFLANLGLLFFFMLDMKLGVVRSLWEMVLSAFEWLVPPGEGNMKTYVAFASTLVANGALFFIALLAGISGALEFFAARERADAQSIYDQIPEVGSTPRIRGLAKESRDL